MTRREGLVGGCSTLARHSLALVTADAEAHVVVLSLASVAAAAHDACVV